MVLNLEDNKKREGGALNFKFGAAGAIIGALLSTGGNRSWPLNYSKRPFTNRSVRK
jgi:hypothetical protein